MSLHQQPCNEQKAHDWAMVQEMISPGDDLLTMRPEKVNAILVALNGGRTLEEAARLANEFLGMLGQIRTAYIYSTIATDDGGLSDSPAQNVPIVRTSRSNCLLRLLARHW